MISLSGPALEFIDRESALYRKLAAANPRLAAKDATLWGNAAQAEAAIRLNWVDLPTTSRQLIPELALLRERFSGASRLILCGMGGSSLGPEVIAATYGKDIFICDSTDPNYLAHALVGDLSKTVIVVGSKSGSTLETSSQRAFFEEFLRSHGYTPQEHMVIVTDPQSPLDTSSRNAGFTVINADPHVGGRFSVLSAFGLVPAALIGVDVSDLLESASSTHEALVRSTLAIDAAFILATQSDQYLGFTDAGSALPGLSDWIEQLIAESTGKDGRGRLPVVVESAEQARSVGFGISYSSGGNLNVVGDLGSHFIFWEWVTALLGVALEIDPFNQPNVTEAKEQSAALLKEWGRVVPALQPDSVNGSRQYFGGSLRDLINVIPEDGYLAIMAYLDRVNEKDAQKLRSILAEKTGKPVTFGWGPRFLHSTGQFHKAGQPNGAFLQISGECTVDFDVPGAPYSFKTLINAQYQGDGRALRARKYPTLHIHLTDRKAGLSELIAEAIAL